MSRSSSSSFSSQSQAPYPEMYARADPVALERIHNEFYYEEDDENSNSDNVITVITTTTTTKEIRLPRSRSRANSFTISDEEGDGRPRFSISSSDDQSKSPNLSRLSRPSSTSTSSSLLPRSRSYSSSSLVRDPISGRLSFDESRLSRDTGSWLSSLSRSSSNSSSSSKASDSYDHDETSGWFSRSLNSPRPGSFSGSSIRSSVSDSDTVSDLESESDDSDSFVSAASSPTRDWSSSTTLNPRRVSFDDSSSDSDNSSPLIASSFTSAIDSAKRGLRRVRSALSSSRYDTEKTTRDHSLRRSSSFSGTTGGSPTFDYSRDITSDDLLPHTPRRRVGFA